MVKVMYNNKLVYKVVIWVYFGVIVWNEKEIVTSKDTNSCLEYSPK